MNHIFFNAGCQTGCVEFAGPFQCSHESKKQKYMRNTGLSHSHALLSISHTYSSCLSCTRHVSVYCTTVYSTDTHMLLPVLWMKKRQHLEKSRNTREIQDCHIYTLLSISHTYSSRLLCTRYVSEYSAAVYSTKKHTNIHMHATLWFERAVRNIHV